MILVTGASGFLGQYLVRFLAQQGCNVRALYHEHAPDTTLSRLTGIEWQQCDLLDIISVDEAMQGISHVYHCAAKVSYNPAEQENMLHFNTESTINIVNAALEAGITKMVHVSSVAALTAGDDPNAPITEANEWNNNRFNTAYGLSKFLSEMEVWRGIGEGLNAVIVNPGIILGAGDYTRGSAQIMQMAYNEFPYYTNGATAWVDAEDVVTAMYRLMNSTLHTERYILSSGTYSYRHIVTQMAERLGRKAPHIHAGPALTGLVWRTYAVKKLLTGKAPLITKATARTAANISDYSNEKILSALPGFRFTDIAVSIQKMANSYKS